MRYASITHLVNPATTSDMIPYIDQNQNQFPNNNNSNEGISTTVTKGVVSSSELESHKGEAWYRVEKSMYEKALYLGFYKNKKKENKSIYTNTHESHNNTYSDLLLEIHLNYKMMKLKMN